MKENKKIVAVNKSYEKISKQGNAKQSSFIQKLDNLQRFFRKVLSFMFRAFPYENSKFLLKQVQPAFH